MGSIVRPKCIGDRGLIPNPAEELTALDFLAGGRGLLPLPKNFFSTLGL